MHSATIFGENGSVLATRPFDTSLPVPATQLKAAGERIRIRLEVPIRDLAGYFNPDLTGGPVTRLDWTIAFHGAAARNYPLLTFFNQGGENRFTVFADNLVDDFSIRARMNQQNATYDVDFTFAVRKPYKPFAVHVDTKGGPWPDAVARAFETLRPQGLPRFPEAAFEPVYCTWYAVHAALTIDYLDANAKLAAELGCRTFIVDDGWCYEDSKRVTPETLVDWYRDIGNWTVSEKKLPGFKKHIESAQALGLKYLLWVAPFITGTRSEFAKSLKPEDWFNGRFGEYFDLRSRKHAEATLKKMDALVRDWGLDGLKVDFLDYEPALPEEPRGRETFDFVKRLAAIIRRRAGADALIEFRQRYATPQMLDFGTQFRAGDVPFDYLLNLSRVATIRILLGNDVPVHADPLYWREDEMDLTVARHMIASLAGVPMVSMDLAKLRSAHKAIVSNYLGFYREHLQTFAHGKWTVRFRGSLPAYVAVTRGKERIVILVDECRLPEAVGAFKGSVHVLNLTTCGIDAASAFNAKSKPVQGAIPPGGRGVL